MEIDRSIRNSMIGMMMTIMMLLYLLLVATLWGSGRKEIARCADFSNQSFAQRRFRSNTKAFANLDRNKDGIACNDLPKS